MKWFKAIFAVMLLAGSMASTAAWADRYHHGSHVGVVIGVPGPWGYAGPYPYSSPYYYPPYGYPYPPVVVAPSPPPTYIQRDSAPAVEEQQSNDWFYCRKPDGYYPYVKQCPGGWQRVAPQPPQ